MVATMQNQNSSLLDATTVRDVVMRDDEDELRKIIMEKGTEEVWRSLRLDANVFHVAVQSKALKCLKELLGNSPPQEVSDAPDHEGRTPLMIAVAEAKCEIVEMLIKAGAYLDSRDNTGKSALHILVPKISSGKKSEDLQKITTLLLDHPNINLEPHNQDHFTPLEIAAKELLQSDDAPKTKRLIMFCEQLENKGVSMTAKIGPRTIKEIIQSKQSLSTVTKDLELNSEPLRRKSSEFIEMIMLGKSMEKIQEFLNEEMENGCNVAKSKLGSKSLLFYAIGRVNMPLVEILLEAGADPWVPEIAKDLPIYRAAATGHYEIFNLLIKKMKGKKVTIDLHEHSFRILQKIIENSANQKEISDDIDYSKCLTRLMEKDVIMDLNQEEHRETILQVAASFNNQDALSKLLQHGAFLGARRRGFSKVYGNILPFLLPETLTDAMDGCITYQPSSKGTSEPENILNKDYTLKLDYRFLVPPIKKDENDKPKKINELKTLMEISRSKHHRPVIKHPLIQALLYAKWCKARPLYGINVLIYSVFTILLTFFVYTVKDLRIFEGRVNKTSNFVPSNSSLVEDIDSLQMTVNGLIGGLMIFNVYMLIREIVQIAVDRKIYCNNIENCLEWFLLAAIFVLCFVPLSANWTRHLSAWAMIVAWFELVLILGRASPLTIYITMLRHVSWNIGKFTIVYGLLVLAFTFSFSIILQPNEHPDFGDFWSTLPKMIAMGTGEFEYSSLSEQFAHKVFFHFIFVTFLIFIFLILMNVMIGLAVADTQEVVEDAKLYSLTTRLELLYLGEVLILKLYRWMPFVATRFESLLNRFQFLPGDQNSASEDLNRGILYVKVNKPEGIWQTPCGKNPERDDSEGFIRLNDETAECLRSHHIHHLEEENKKRHGDSMNQEEDKKHCGDMMNKCLRILEEVQQRLQKA